MDRGAVIVVGYVCDAGRLLAKMMNSCRLNETLSTGVFDMKPTVKSLAIKAKNRQWRASKKEQDRSQDPDN